MKSCNNCAINLKVGCTLAKKNELCPKWKDARANCEYCIYLEDCQALNKKVAVDFVCPNFVKRKERIRLNRQLVVTSDIGSKSVKNLEPVDFNPADAVEEIIVSGYEKAVAEKINDRDLPWATNPLKFILSPKFMGIKLFARQYVIFADLLAAYCPRCSDTKFIRTKVEVDTSIEELKNRTQLYRDGKCKKCGHTRSDAIANGSHKFYNQLVGCAGQRSGKSVSCAILFATVLHEYLKMPDPVEKYKLLLNTPLTGTFVGLRYNDAHDNLWLPFYNLVKETRWFNMYHEFLESESIRLSHEVFKFRDSYVAYTYKNIALHPSGPDKRKLRGRTRWMAALDEVGWFNGKVDGVLYNADEVYAALDNSLMTLRSSASKLIDQYPDLPNAYGVYISSPSSKTDPIMRMYKKSIDSHHTYGYHFPTWEFNPDITKDDLADKFMENPVTAERDFGANPPYSNDPFIRSPAELITTFSKKPNVIQMVRKKITRDSLGGKLMYPIIDFTRVHSIPSILAIDAGFSNNSYACSLIHWAKDKEGIDRKAISGILEIKPKPYPLSFPKIYKRVITPILENFNIKLVAFDRWESINLSQLIYEDFEIDTVRYSVTYSDFDDLKSDILSGEIIHPKLEIEKEKLLELEENIDNLVGLCPVSHLFLQYLLSKDTGRTVTKGDDATDDILRTVALGMSLLTNEEYSDMFTSEEDEVASHVEIDSIIAMGSLSSSTRSGVNQTYSDIGIVSSFKGSSGRGGGVFTGR